MLLQQVLVITDDRTRFICVLHRAAYQVQSSVTTPKIISFQCCIVSMEALFTLYHTYIYLDIYLDSKRTTKMNLLCYEFEEGFLHLMFR